MYTSSYSVYGSGLGSSLASRTALPPVPSSPSYSSPYSGYTRYRDYSNAKFGDISAYSTPVNYPTPRLSRGLSVQDVSTLGDHGAARRLARQSSLDQQRDHHRHSHQHRDPHRHSPLPSGHYENAYQDLLKTSRTPSRTGKEEKKRRPISCNKVYPGIIIGNGETVCDISYLKSLGVTHVLNTAEEHVMVNPAKYANHGIKYQGFHVDDLPHCDISRYFHRSTDFIHSCVSAGGLVVVNCYMGLSRSASCVLAYLIAKQDMSLTKALDYIKRSRAVRPNEGFLKQLRVFERQPRY